jgi:hypothetical protein
MSRTTFAIVASALMAAGCGNPSPTAPEGPPVTNAGEGLSTFGSTACAAQSISAAYTPIAGRHLITVVFLDSRGNDIAPIDCPDLVWSVTPQGAQVQPLFDGSRTITQAQLIVTGATQLYTVTAASGSLRASVQVLAGR